MTAFSSSETLLKLLNVQLPIIQAPMASVSTAAMAAAVCNTGALGSIGVGAADASAARKSIRAVRELAPGRSFNVNVFCHRPPSANPARDSAWTERLRPEFRRLGIEPPAILTEIYRSFLQDESMLAMLLEERPPVVSFHFGVPSTDCVRSLREAGIVLLGSATSLSEARTLESAGIHAVVAQGYEAGGHRGVFDPDVEDDCLSTMALTRLLVRELGVPTIATGAIMDGKGIAAALHLGAAAAQLGTAFIACPESEANEGYRANLFSRSAHHTLITRAISGRPARCLPNRFTAFGAGIPPHEIPAYPLAYHASKALIAAAKGDPMSGYGAHWAGQGAPLARSLPAARLIAELLREMAEA